MEQKNEENVYIEKKIFIFSVFLLATLIITAVMISYLLLNNKIIESSSTIIEFEPDTPAFEIKDEATTKKEIYYVLKEYNGKIGVYENESLIYTLDIYVFTLPEVDKQLLKDGIIVSTKEKLCELIEEYY